MSLYRKVIQITAMDSPNVRLGLAEMKQGLPPSHETVIADVLSMDEYIHRRQTWDKVRQCIGLDAKFWKGSNLLMFPPDWLDHSEKLAKELAGGSYGAVLGIGIDPAEGGDATSMSAVNMRGLVDQVSEKTPNTSVICPRIIEFMKDHRCDAERVCIDRGGGGKQIADQLRQKGYDVRTIGFGAAVATEPRRGTVLFNERLHMQESRYTYFNRRAQMYGTLRELMNPFGANGGWAISQTFSQRERGLREQLAPIPLSFDGEQRLKLLPKNKPNPDHKGPTLIDLIGYSPDDADSVVLAIHAMLFDEFKPTAGGF